MEVQSTAPSQTLDAKLNDALDATSAEGLDAMSKQKRRLRRIEEFEEASLSRDDPYAAMIGASNAEFQQLSDQLTAALLREFDDQPPTIELVRELSPEIRLLLKLRKAVEFDRQVCVPEFEQGIASFPAKIQSPHEQPRGASARPAGLIPKQWSSKR